jgi:formamidopyrimidine-DNA glycosylase
MPELPEVETVARGLRSGVSGKRIAKAEILHPGVIAGSVEQFVIELRGRRIAGVERKGKVLFLKLEPTPGRLTICLIVRLGMTGQVTVRPRAAPLEPHTHVRLALDRSRREIRFRDIRRFGRLRVASRGEMESLLAALGPDAQQITGKDFVRAARGRSGAVKSWLMNQKGLSGLGNIYADEALFIARIHPLARPARLSKRSLVRLHRAVQSVLGRAVALQGTSLRDYVDIEGRPGNFLPRLRVYQRTGKPCRRCGAPIRRMVVAGRSSHFCPRCQPRPRTGLR